MSLKRQIEAEAKRHFATLATKGIAIQQLSEISDPLRVEFTLNGVDYEAVFFESELQEVQWHMPGVQGKIKYKR